MQDSRLPVQDTAVKTEEPSYVMPDLSALWKSEKDKMVTFPLEKQYGVKQSTRNEYSETTEEFTQLWKSIEADASKDLREPDSDKCDKTCVGLQSLAKSSSLESSELAINRIHSLISPQKDCFYCKVPIEKTKLKFQYDLLIDFGLGEGFCHDCIQNIFKPTCNPLVGSAVCSQSEKESEADATSLLWKDPEVSDKSDETCVGSQRLAKSRDHRGSIGSLELAINRMRSLLSSKHNCSCCKVPAEKAKLKYQYGCQTNLEICNEFCRDSIRNVFKPTCNPPVGSATCPRSEKESEADATSLIWNKPEGFFKTFYAENGHGIFPQI